MSKISQYAPLTSPQPDDVLAIVDVHDTSMAPSGTTKKITLGDLTPGEPWVTLPANWYAGPWFTGKASLPSTPMWILFDGDSITNGVNPTSSGYLAIGWPDQLRTSLLASLGASVYGDFYPVWAYSQTAGAADPVNEGFPAPSSVAGQEGGFGACLSPTANNVWCQTISTGSIPGWTGGGVTGFDLVYYDFFTTTWGFLIDGGQGGSPTVTGATWTGTMWQVSNTTSGSGYTTGNIKKVTVRGLTSGTHTIQWGQVASFGNMQMIGISLFTGSTGGLGFVRNAYSGRRAVDFATPGGATAGFAGTLPSFPNDKIAGWSGSGPSNASHAQITPTPFGFPTAPTLAFIGLGVNDCSDMINPAAYANAIERKIAAIRRGVANANIGLISFCFPDSHNSDTNIPGGGNGVRWDQWKRVTAGIAATYNCAYIDIDAKWGPHPVALGFMQAGDIHPVTAGYADIASVIAGIL